MELEDLLIPAPDDAVDQRELNTSAPAAEPLAAEVDLPRVAAEVDDL